MKNDRILRKAMRELDSFYWSQEELAAYEEAEKKKRDQLAVLAQKFDEGIEKGIKLGIEKGIEKGALQAKSDMAHVMLQEHMSDQMIVRLTGLTQDERDVLKGSS